MGALALSDVCDVRVPPTRRGDALALTLTYLPEQSADGGALVASPLPFLGGDMDNNVVRTLATTCARAGLPALRYDYRSVGDSHDVHPGTSRYEHWRRVEETRDRSAVASDASEALRRARRLFRPLLLAGYSFGCWTALHTSALLGSDVALVLVAPPLVHVDVRVSAAAGARTLVVLAADDALSPAPPDVELSERFPGARIDVVAGADHFFRGREHELAALVSAFVGSRVRPAGGGIPC